MSKAAKGLVGYLILGSYVGHNNYRPMIRQRLNLVFGHKYRGEMFTSRIDAKTALRLSNKWKTAKLPNAEPVEYRIAAIYADRPVATQEAGPVSATLNPTVRISDNTKGF